MKERRVSCPSERVLQNCMCKVGRWTHFGRCKKMGFLSLKATEPRITYLLMLAGFYARYCLGLSSGERERRMEERERVRERTADIPSI